MNKQLLQNGLIFSILEKQDPGLSDRTQEAKRGIWTPSSRAGPWIPDLGPLGSTLVKFTSYSSDIQIYRGNQKFVLDYLMEGPIFQINLRGVLRSTFSMKYIYNKNRIKKSTQTLSEGIIFIFIFYYQFYDCVFIMSHTRFSVNLHSVVA